MARRRTASSDSLELLLDTMCNAFGGIVLIAIMVALLTREAKIEKEKTVGQTDASEMTDAEAQKIQRDIEDLEKRNADIEGELDGFSEIEEMTEKHSALSSALAQAREEIENLTRQLAENARKNQSNRSARMREMNRELAQAANDAADMQREIADMEKQRESLTRAIEELEKQTRDQVADGKRTMRPPKLHETKRSSWSFILRYGEIYPVEVFTVDASGNQSNDGLNESTIDWVRLNIGNVVAMQATPKKGKGLAIGSDTTAIQNLLKKIIRVNRKNAVDESKQLYAVGLVYRDSFDEFIVFQKLIREMGIPSGWKPVPGDKNLIFASGGKGVEEG